MHAVVTMIERAEIAFALSSIVWVLVVQSVGLLRSMPRRQFLPLQMQLVRIWSRALAAITAVVALAALVRSGLHAWPAVAAFVVAALCAQWAIPRALRSGGRAASSDEPEAMSATGFIADGGGEATHTWHRVVLLFMAFVIAGLGLELHTLDGHRATEHTHESPSIAPHASAIFVRVPIDRATVANIAQLERDTATVLSAGGDGDVSAIRAGWNRIFAQCTTRGPAHDRLHEFLIPLAAIVTRAESSTGPARKTAVRELLAGLGRFDAGFTAAE